MKAYLKILPYMGIVLGLLGLLLLLSFSSGNACQMANSDVISLKAHTNKALKMNDLEMSRYHTFKALRSLEKTKGHLNNCGCEPALVTAKDAEISLKKAVSSKKLEDSRTFLKIALENTLITIEALKNYNDLNVSATDNSILAKSLHKDAKPYHGASELQKKMDSSLTKFKASLSEVVQHVDCRDAFEFVNEIIDKSDRQLKRKTLSRAQGQYHLGVKTIAYEALVKLEGCPNK